MERAKSDGASGRIAYIFDAGHKNRGEFEKAHAKETEEARKAFMLGPLAFDNEDKIPPLQAADLLAYELAQYHQGRTNRHPLLKITQRGESHLRWSRQSLIGLRNNFLPDCPFVP
jgi:hypothetical protein